MNLTDAPAFWWDHELPSDDGDSRVHESLFDHVRSIEERQSALHRLNLYNAKLYTNRKLACLTWGTHTEEEGSYGPQAIRRENIIANGVDTATALIGRQRPKPTPVPRDADFSIEMQASMLDQWLYNEFRDHQAYDKMQQVFNDSCWANIGALYCDIVDGEIYTERVMPDEIVVDQRECSSEAVPLQMHRRRLVSKVVIMAMYPDAGIELDKEGSAYTSYRSPSHEMCVVIESWKLPLHGQPGRHSIVTEHCTLVDEEYKRERFPFIFLRWTKLPTGFYGRSLVEEGAPFQIRHDELNEVIRKAQDIMCVPRVFVDGASRISKTQLDNEIARVIHYRGKPPQVMQWSAVSPELYSQRAENKAAFFEHIGFSRMSAQAKVPDGVRFDSSKALREAHFRENERFQQQSTRLEAAYLELADMMLEYAIELHSGRVPPKKWEERTLLDEIDWKALGRPGRVYTLNLEASSLNNMTPAAREDQLNQWANNGLITPDQYKALLGHPDLEEEVSLFEAGVNDIKAVGQVLDKGEWEQPDPLQNLTFGIPFLHKVYLKRKRQKNVPPEVLDAYRDWLSEAEAIIEGEDAMQSAQQLGTQLGPEGTPAPAVATTVQGVPTTTLM